MFIFHDQNLYLTIIRLHNWHLLQKRQVGIYEIKIITY